LTASFIIPKTTDEQSDENPQEGGASLQLHKRSSNPSTVWNGKYLRFQLENAGIGVALPKAHVPHFICSKCCMSLASEIVLHTKVSKGLQAVAVAGKCRL